MATLYSCVRWVFVCLFVCFLFQGTWRVMGGTELRVDWWLQNVREMDHRWEDHIERVRVDVDNINVTRDNAKGLNVVHTAI